MFNAFNIHSLLFGVFLTVPLVLGCLLLIFSYIRHDYPTKAQKVAGILFLADALYLVIRTYLMVNNDMGSDFERTIYYITDSTIITIFGLVPYTIIFEKYPKWWHYLVAISPLTLIPVVYFTNLHFIAMWSHLLPIFIGLFTIIYLNKYAHKIDSQLSYYFADPELHTKSWIINISIFYLILTCLSMIRYILPGHIGFNMIISLSWSLIMFILFVFLIRQQPANIPEQYNIEEPVRKEARPVIQPKVFVTPKNTSVSKSQAYESIGRALKERCVEEKLYLNRDLNLYSLARVCGTNRTYLTDYLHEQLHQTFYDYINTLRMVHVDELLETTKLSQEAIALQCGFNSAQTLRSAYFKIRGKELKRRKEGKEEGERKME